MKRKSLTLFQTLVILIAFSACGAGKEKQEENLTENTSSATVVESIPTVSSDEAKQKPKIPKPQIELPAIGYNKAELPTVTKLDQLIVDEQILESAYKAVYVGIQQLEEATETPMSGTSTDIVKAIMNMKNGVTHFEDYYLSIANEAVSVFQKKYEDDYSFSNLYRETYYAAEEEINGHTLDDGSQIIQDDVKRREASTHFRNGYQPSRSSEVSSMQDLLEQAQELKKKVIGKVTSQANIDMMVADYKKGKELTDMLNTTLANLNTISTLDPLNSEVASMQAKVEEKKVSRAEEVRRALETYRFPKRYAAGNAPDNDIDLEHRISRFLSEFNYTNNNKYEVIEVKLAGPWIDIFHALTGEHLYSQVDFYIAVPSPSQEGIVDVLYVTGKTSGPHHESFGKYSVGGIGEMLASNL